MSKGGVVLAEFKLAQAQHDVGAPMVGAQGDNVLERARSLHIFVLFIQDGSERPPSFSPSRPHPQRFAIEHDCSLQIVCAPRLVRLCGNALKWIPRWSFFLWL